MDAVGARDLPDEPRLPDASLADDGDDLAMSLAGLLVSARRS